MDDILTVLTFIGLGGIVCFLLVGIFWGLTGSRPSSAP